MRAGRGVAAVVPLACLARGSPAAAEGPGTTAFRFLTLGAGARIEAMGEAGTAAADGVDALTWNPARLGAGKGREVAVSYFNWLQDVQVAQGGATWPLGRAFLGVGARSMRVSDFGNVPGEGDIGQSDLAIGAGAAYPLTSGFRAGAGVKLVRSSLAGEDATGFVGDLGLNYEWVEGWDLAAALRNFGPAFGYVPGVDEPLPTQGAIALAATVGKLKLDSEVLWEDGPGWTGVVGAEYRLLERIRLRAGSRLGEESGGAREPWAAGIGIAARSDVELEYAYRDGTLEASHRLGIRWIPGQTPGDVDLARSSKEFYKVMLQEAFEAGGLATVPRPDGSVLVRASAPNEAAEAITNTLVRYLKDDLGWEAEPGQPWVAIPDTLSAEQREQALASGYGFTPDGPLLQYDILDSRYEILASHRARWVGPKSVDRRAAVDVDLTLTAPDVDEPLWTGKAVGEKRELVALARIPASGGYPQARTVSGESAAKLHPLVEPAIVGGLVAGLAVIFFSNRDVGQ
jgi:hypothetical protein